MIKLKKINWYVISDPYDVIRLFPTLLPQYSQDDSNSNDNQITKSQNRDFEKSLPALIEYLTEVFIYICIFFSHIPCFNFESIIFALLIRLRLV